MAMNSRVLFPLLPLLLFSVLLVHDQFMSICGGAIILISPNDEGTMVEACRHTSFRDLCVESLKSDHRSYEANYHGLARVSIELAFKNGTDTYTYFKRLANQTSDIVLKYNLNNCVDYYMSGMIMQIPQALQDFDRNLFKPASDCLSHCVQMAKSCGDGLPQAPPERGRPFPLQHRNDVAGGLCSIAYDLVRMISN